MPIEDSSSEDESSSKLFQNAGYCSVCDKIFVSIHGHDFTGCQHGFIDGGTSYVRGGGNLQSLAVYTSDSRESIKDKLVWGTYGKNGDEPLKRKFLKDLDTDHLQAILTTQTRIHPLRKQAILDILAVRKTYLS